MGQVISKLDVLEVQGQFEVISMISVTQLVD